MNIVQIDLTTDQLWLDILFVTVMVFAYAGKPIRSQFTNVTVVMVVLLWHGCIRIIAGCACSFLRPSSWHPLLAPLQGKQLTYPSYATSANRGLCLPSTRHLAFER